MVWLSETLLITVLLIGTQKIIASWGQSVFLPELAWNLAMILLACLYRWLIWSAAAAGEAGPDLAALV